MEGRELRDQGIAQVQAARDVFMDKAATAILRLALSGKSFTAEDVRAVVGDPPHPNCMGAALMTAARRGAIYRYGFATAERGSAHARSPAVWRLKRPIIRGRNERKA